MRVLVGLDVGGTDTKCVTLAAEAQPRVLHGSVLPTRGHEGPSAAVDRFLGHLETVAGGGDLAAIGIALPGVCDVPAGEPVFVPNLGAAWERFPLAEMVGERLGVPVRILNDLHALTLAELRLGAGRGCSELLCVAVGTGVGGGLALGGRLFLGTDFTAGAIGHTTVELDGPPCVCGSPGCVEAVASAGAIAAAAGTTSSAQAAAAAEVGDDRARQAWRTAGRYLGAAIANVVTMLTPQRVVVGGGVAACGDLLLAPIREEVARRVRVASTQGLEIVPAELGIQAGAIGAALWAAETREAGGSCRPVAAEAP